MSVYILQKDWRSPNGIIKAGAKFTKTESQAQYFLKKGQENLISRTMMKTETSVWPEYVENSDWFAKEEEPKDEIQKDKLYETVRYLVRKELNRIAPSRYYFTDMVYTEKDVRIAFMAGVNSSDCVKSGTYSFSDWYKIYSKTINP